MLYPELTDLSLSSLLPLHPRSTQIPDVALAVTDNQFHIPSHEGIGTLWTEATSSAIQLLLDLSTKRSSYKTKTSTLLETTGLRLLAQ
jgi:hypothetical protein